MSGEVDFHVSVVLPASGSGERMGLPSPKQFCGINDKPLIVYSIQLFHRISWIKHIVVTTGKEYVDYLQSLCLEYGFGKVTVTLGDTARHRSIYRGIKMIQAACEEPDIVIIHDAVRLFAQEQTIQKIALAAKQHGVIIGTVEPATDGGNQLFPFLDPNTKLGVCISSGLWAAGVTRPLVSTIISVDADGYLKESLDRSKYRASEMPQGFQYEVIRNAYEQATDYDFDYGTECLHLAQKYSKVPVFLIEGSPDLWKVTYQKDLHAAEAMMKEKLMKLCIIEEENYLSESVEEVFSKSSNIKIERKAPDFEDNSELDFNTFVLYHNKKDLAREDIKNEILLIDKIVSRRKECSESNLFNTIILHVIKTFTEQQFYDLHRACIEILKNSKTESHRNNVIWKALIFREKTLHDSIGKFVKDLVWNRDPMFSGQVFSI